MLFILLFVTISVRLTGFSPIALRSELNHGIRPDRFRDVSDDDPLVLQFYLVLILDGFGLPAAAGLFRVPLDHVVLEFAVLMCHNPWIALGR